MKERKAENLVRGRRSTGRKHGGLVREIEEETESDLFSFLFPLSQTL